MSITALLAGLCLLAYPLSTGPAKWLYERGHLPGGLARLLAEGYVPLFWLVRGTRTDRLLTRYINWWSPLDAAPRRSWRADPSRLPECGEQRQKPFPRKPLQRQGR